MHSKADYATPTHPRIVRTIENDYLYRLEDEAKKHFEIAARELGRIMGHDEDQFWTHTLPEALWSFLEQWDHHASLIAAKEYVRFHEAKTKGGTQ